jgi:hypothetical protein
MPNDEGQESFISKEDMDEMSVLDNDPGGDIPSKSLLKLKAGKQYVGYQLKEGQKVRLHVDAVVKFVGFGDGERVHDLLPGSIWLLDADGKPLANPDHGGDGDDDGATAAGEGVDAGAQAAGELERPAAGELEAGEEVVDAQVVDEEDVPAEGDGGPEPDPPAQEPGPPEGAAPIDPEEAAEGDLDWGDEGDS